MTRKSWVPLEPEDIALLQAALDSHIYWQLSDTQYRNDGYVNDPGSDDEEAVQEIQAARALNEILAKYAETSS